jgi:hypothetical protein
MLEKRNYFARYLYFLPTAVFLSHFLLQEERHVFSAAQHDIYFLRLNDCNHSLKFLHAFHLVHKNWQDFIGFAKNSAIREQECPKYKICKRELVSWFCDVKLL